MLSVLTALPLVMVVMSPLSVFARPINGDVPVDGGLSLLVAAGVGYAVKRMYNKRKKEAVNIEK